MIYLKCDKESQLCFLKSDIDKASPFCMPCIEENNKNIDKEHVYEAAVLNIASLSCTTGNDTAWTCNNCGRKYEHEPKYTYQRDDGILL